MKKILGILLALLFSAPSAPPALPLQQVAQGAGGLRRAAPPAPRLIKKAVATGSVVPRKEVEIKPQVSGILEELFVEPGQIVKQRRPGRQGPHRPEHGEPRQRREPRQARQDRPRAGASATTTATRRWPRTARSPRADFQQFEIACATAKEELKAAKDNLDLSRRGPPRGWPATTTRWSAPRSPAWSSKSRSRWGAR